GVQRIGRSAHLRGAVFAAHRTLDRDPEHGAQPGRPAHDDHRAPDRDRIWRPLVSGCPRRCPDVIRAEPARAELSHPENPEQPGWPAPGAHSAFTVCFWIVAWDI